MDEPCDFSATFCAWLYEKLSQRRGGLSDRADPGNILIVDLNNVQLHYPYYY